MICKHPVAAVILAGCFLALSGPAGAQRRHAQPAGDETLPLCREAGAGERCRTRNGTILTRRDPRPAPARDPGQTQNLGGGDPGWEVGDPRPGSGRDPAQTQNLGGGDPGWEVGDPRPGSARDPGQTQNLGGGDPGWEVGDPRPGSGRAPAQTQNLGGGAPGWEVGDQDGIKPPGTPPAGEPEK